MLEPSLMKQHHLLTVVQTDARALWCILPDGIADADTEFPFLYRCFYRNRLFRVCITAEVGKQIVKDALHQFFVDPQELFRELWQQLHCKIVLPQQIGKVAQQSAKCLLRCHLRWKRRNIQTDH